MGFHGIQLGCLSKEGTQDMNAYPETMPSDDGKADWS